MPFWGVLLSVQCCGREGMKSTVVMPVSATHVNNCVIRQAASTAEGAPSWMAEWALLLPCWLSKSGNGVVSPLRG